MVDMKSQVKQRKSSLQFRYIPHLFLGYLTGFPREIPTVWSRDTGTETCKLCIWEKFNVILGLTIFFKTQISFHTVCTRKIRKPRNITRNSKYGIWHQNVQYLLFLSKLYVYRFVYFDTSFIFQKCVVFCKV